MKRIKFVLSLFDLRGVVILGWASFVLTIYLLMTMQIGQSESGYIMTWVYPLTFLLLQIIPFLVGIYSVTRQKDDEK